MLAQPLTIESISLIHTLCGLISTAPLEELIICQAFAWSCRCLTVHFSCCWFEDLGLKLHDSGTWIGRCGCSYNRTCGRLETDTDVSSSCSLDPLHRAFHHSPLHWGRSLMVYRLQMHTQHSLKDNIAISYQSTVQVLFSSCRVVADCPYSTKQILPFRTGLYT